MRTFEYRHIVSFEETNLLGNVYYTNHLSWQGKCREMFLQAYVPEILAEFEQGLALVTIRCLCNYFAELSAFDEIAIRMKIGSIAQNRVTMLFDYVRLRGKEEELIAKGEQQIACMQRQSGHLLATQIPAKLREALQRYAEVELMP
jgi:enediyne core biosynthesis thioesterase